VVDVPLYVPICRTSRRSCALAVVLVVSQYPPFQIHESRFDASQ
jgi:hypothetical protein